MSHEKLLENYEDALFALLMEQVAETEGQILNEQNELLKHDPEAAIQDDLDRKCRRIISKSFSAQRRREALRVLKITFSKVAVFVFLCILLFTVAYAVVPEVRVMTLNLLIEVSDVATSLSFSNNGSSSGSAVGSTPHIGYYGYNLNAIPDDFTVIEEDSSRQFIWIIYKNISDATINIRFGGSATLIYNLDTEDADNVEAILIHEYEGLLIEKGDTVQIVWADNDQGIFVSLLCTNLDKETVVAIANELKNK